MRKKSLLSKLQISYYPEPDCHIREKFKVVLEFSSYATTKITRTCYRCNLSNLFRC